jgi:hypothetical protein
VEKAWIVAQYTRQTCSQPYSERAVRDGRRRKGVGVMAANAIVVLAVRGERLGGVAWRMLAKRPFASFPGRMTCTRQNVLRRCK